MRPLRFHIDLEVELTIGDKKKMLNVVVWNQRWEAVSTIESVFKGGWAAMNWDWWGTLSSLNGLTSILFMTMIGGLLIGNRCCGEINDARTVMQKDLIRDYYIEVANGERIEGNWPKEPEKTDVEWICGI